MGSATNHRAAARSQDLALGFPLVHAKPPAEPTRRSPSSRPIAGHPRCGPYREPQLQRAPTKRDPSSSASRASINALRNPRNIYSTDSKRPLGLYNAGQLPVAPLTGRVKFNKLYTKWMLSNLGKVAGRALYRILLYRSEFYRRSPAVQENSPSTPPK